MSIAEYETGTIHKSFSSFKIEYRDVYIIFLAYFMLKNKT